MPHATIIYRQDGREKFICRDKRLLAVEEDDFPLASKKAEFSGIMKSNRLDQIDIKILAMLQENGRITNQKLSELVGLSARPCLERVRRLEATGYIQRYMALLDATKLGSSIMVIAEIALEYQNKRGQADFEARMKKLNEVIDCFEVSGQFDYIARFVCPDIKAYQDLTAALIEDESLGVARIVSNIVLRPVREFSGFPLKLFLQP